MLYEYMMISLLGPRGTPFDPAHIKSTVNLMSRYSIFSLVTALFCDRKINFIKTNHKTSTTQGFVTFGFQKLWTKYTEQSAASTPLDK